MDYLLEPLVDYACHTGENPLYHPQENAIYWTDIPNGRLFRYELSTGNHEPIEIGRPVGGFTIQADGKLLLFMDQGAIALWCKNAPLEYLIDQINLDEEVVTNLQVRTRASWLKIRTMNSTTPCA